MKIQRTRDIMYFDLETQGLDPLQHRIRCIATIEPKTGEIEVLTATDDASEHDLISNVIANLMLTRQWGGWNITEFDLSFLNVRAYRYNLSFPIEPVDQEPILGKYGNVRVTVPSKRIHDLAYDLKDRTKDLGVEWHLGEMARTVGWKPMCEISGKEAATAPLHQVVAHAIDDVVAIHKLVNEYGIPDYSV